ncbi:MAG: tetratricopeptide repeat protein [Candidatus Heimdallarchaeota archaeon]|nr:tetratricopeptide repeat protein [Candidatus Heimdallarchaeota archaeon]
MNDDVNQEINHIEQLMTSGKYEEAIREVETIIENKTSNLEDVLRLQIYKCKAILEIKPHNFDAFEILDEVVQRSKEGNFQLLEIKAIVLTAHAQAMFERYEEAVMNLQKAEVLLKNAENDDTEEYREVKAFFFCVNGYTKMNQGMPEESRILLRKSFELNRQVNNKLALTEVLNNLGHNAFVRGKFDEVYEFFNQSYEIAKSLGNKHYMFYGLLYTGSSFWKRGKLTEAYSYWKRCLDISTEMNDKIKLADSYNMVAIYYTEIGKLDQSLDNFQKSLGLYEETKNWSRFTLLLNNIGETYWRKGEHNKAIETLNDVIAISNEKSFPLQIAVANRTFGFIYASLGDLDKALDLLLRDIDFFERINYDYYLESLHFIGLIYWQRGDEENSISILSKCIRIKEENNQPLVMTFTLFEIIRIFIEKKDIEQARFYFSKLEEINAQLENKHISLTFRLSEALLLINSELQRKRIKAEYLLEQIIEEPIIFFPYTMDAILSLSEFYLKELRLSGDTAFLSKLDILVNKLAEISMNQKSFSLTIDVLWLKSQLALLNYDTKKAQGLIIQAQELAKEKGFARLYQKFSDELNELKRSLSKWIKFKEERAPASEMLQFVNIDKALETIRNDKTFDAQGISHQRNIHLKHIH